jgi:multidrug efflux system membrane fusion protein
VASDVSATFGGLPHVERTLNWVRIAARFPVRIMLDEPPEDLMRFGASAVIEIKK